MLSSRVRNIFNSEKYDLIFIFISSGPIFGAGADLLISSNCNTNMDSYSNLPHTYDGDGASPSVLMGDYNFSVADYEVFTPINTTAKPSKNERYQ